MAKKAKAVKKANKKGSLKVKPKAKPKPARPKARPKGSDPELALMGRELRRSSRSAMFKEDISKESKSKLVKLDAEARTDNLMSYYKNMVFRCIKCDGRFDHEASLPPLEYELRCPHCSEVHRLKFTPASNLFTVDSKTVDVISNP